MLCRSRHLLFLARYRQNRKCEARQTRNGWILEVEEFARMIMGGDKQWYGIWQDNKYMIAREKENTNSDNLEKAIITMGKYAAFATNRGSLA